MSSIPPAVDAAPSRRFGPTSLLRPLWRLAQWLMALVLAAWSVVLIAWLTLHWGILPRIEQWRPQIEAQASRSLGIPVRIGHIAVRSRGWVPAIELGDVAFLDAQQRSALLLPRVSAAISPRSLLSLELRFEQLLIDGARLDVRRDKAGRLFVAGFDLGETRSGDTTALRDWFFSQREFVIRGGSLRWTDEQRDAPPLELTDLQFALRNGRRQHDIRLDATPEPGWGDRFSLRGKFTAPLLGPRGNWQRWSGQAFIDLPHVDLRQLRRHADLPFELSQGEGGVRAWVDLAEGSPTAATADVALRAVALRLAADVEPLVIEQVQGRLVGQRSAVGGSVRVERLGFVTGDGLSWPAGDLALNWRQGADGQATGGEATAQRLDLAVMAQIATRVPLGAALRRLLGELRPQGTVSGLTAKWQGALDAPARYQASARIVGLSLAAQQSAEPGGVGRPGLRNAALTVSASDAGGQAQVQLRSGAIEFPGVFEQPVLDFDRLDAQLSWTVRDLPGSAPPHIALQARQVVFSNADAQGELRADWSTGAGGGFGRGARYPGLLELDGRVARGRADRVARYLPLGLPETRGYVGRAVQGGRIADASFRIKGDLWEFPFRAVRGTKGGEFRIAGQLSDVTLAYVPSVPATAAEPAFVSPWPALTAVAGELVIDRTTLEIRNGQARQGALQLATVQGAIRDLDHPVLEIDGAVSGPLADMLRFVNATPVGRWTDQMLARSSANGPAELKLALQLPMDDLKSGRAKGSLQLNGNDLRLLPEVPLLGNARGRIDFDNQDFVLAGVGARLLGGDATFDGGTQPDGGVRFGISGTATAEALRRASEPGLAQRVAALLSGQAAYRLQVGHAHGRSEFNLSSNLVGIAIDLPPPLRKSAEAALPLRWQVQPTADGVGAAGPLRDNMRLELGNVLQAAYLRDLAGDSPRVLRGGIGIGEAPPLPANGVRALVNLAALDVDAWQAAAERVLGSDAAGAALAAGGYAPSKVALRVQALQMGSRRLSHVVAGLTQEDGGWQANVDAEQLNGFVDYRAPAGAAGMAGGRVYARLARLALPKSDVEQVESLLDTGSPASVPALDIVVDDFELRGKRLGRVEIEAVNSQRGEAGDAWREWRLKHFSLSMPEAQLTGTGGWAAQPGMARRRTQMRFELEVRDAGALLERFGSGKAIRGGKGQVAGEVAWLGSPFALDYPSLAGQMRLAIDAGQFLKAEPGASRLLGVLSLQSLPRRLALDFRDVFQEGFAFDNITGDIVIAQGVAQTNNLRMRGVQAAVLMEGRADIARETQDLRVVVVPEINAGTASLAYAAINPAIGLGTFLAQALLRRPLIRASTREFHVSGPWDDPKVERIERRADAALPEREAPGGAAAPASAAQ